MNTTTEQGLERAAASTPAVITTPAEYRGALLRWQEQRFNILTPFTNISGLAPSHGIISSLVQVSTELAAGEVYDGLPFLKKDEVALSKIGLRKLAECAGISTRTERTDPRTIPHYWEMKAIATYRGVDGAVVSREATMEWDLRDGSDRLKGWTTNQISEARKHGLRACEARAINAAIRECGCGIKQKYHRQELAKPFVVIRVAFQPDMSDPDTKRLVTERALQGTSALYAPPAPALGPATDSDPEPDPEPRSVGRGSTMPAKTEDAPAKPDPDQPPTRDAVRIVDVTPTSGETKGRKWTRYVIVDSNGCEHSTFDKSLADFAEQAKQAKRWVEITEEVDGQYKNLVEIVPAGQQPSLLPDADKL